MDVCQPRVFARTARRLAGLFRTLYPDTPSLSPDEFAERSQQQEWSVVDARSPSEQSVSMIRSAQSKGAFEGSEAAHPSTPVLVYCMSGLRSASYVRTLRAKGIEAYGLAGGLLAWVVAGKTLVAPDGRPTCQVAAWGGIERALPPGYRAVEGRQERPTLGCA
jgi:rhodanese-related sulfurtransferase